MFAAEGERHDGSRTSSGDAHIDVPAGQTGIEARSSYVHIDGMRLSLAATSIGTAGVTVLDATGEGIVENVCVLFSAHTATASAITFETYTAASSRGIIRNNMTYGLDTVARGAGIVVRAAAVGAVRDATATVESNTVVGMSTTGTSRGIEYVALALTAAATVTIKSVNNVVVSEAANCFGQTTGGATPTVDVEQTACASTDATAAMWGGDGNLTDQLASELFDDPTDATTPSEFGPLDMAGVNRYTDGVTSDAMDTPRPTIGLFAIGAATLYRQGASVHNVYRGDSAGEVDYDTLVGRARGSGPLLSVQNIALPADQTSYLGVRRVSLAGVEETNTDRIAAVTLDAAGQVVAGTPGAVRTIAVHALADGSFVVGFSQPSGASPATPDRFEVFSDGGTGTLQTDQPVATVAARAGREDYTVRLKPAERPGVYGVQAISGEQRSAMITAEVAAGLAAPQPPTLL